MKPCCEAYLNEQFGGDADVVGEIYSEYVTSLKDKIAEAAAALEGAQWDVLDKAAHTIKGNALAAGDTETAEAGIALRSTAKLQDRDGSAALIAKLEGFSKEL